MKEEMTLKRAIIEVIQENPFPIGIMSCIFDAYFKTFPVIAISVFCAGLLISTIDTSEKRLTE